MSIRRSAPLRLKQHARSAALRWGVASASARVLPGFVLAGAQRAGTTSMYRALMTHPCIAPPVMHKGVNYFDVNYGRGLDWYRGHFPLRATLRRRAARLGAEPVAFDASGYYMFHPVAAERMAADLPHLKVLVMLRDPVERAYSAHRHESARGFETEPFERALELEEERLDGEEARLRADPAYASTSWRHHAYKRRGHYADQLTRLARLFPPEQIHVVESERFFTSPEEEYARVLAFLGLPVVMPEAFDRYNSRPRSPMPEPVRTRLREHFAGHDHRLATLLGRPPAWLC